VNVVRLESRVLVSAVSFLLAGMNADRRQAGVAPLIVEWHLQAAARARVHQELRVGYLGEQGFPADIFGAGYLGAYLGENDGFNFGYGRPVAELLAQWRDSPPHQANVVDAAFQDVGIAVATGRHGRTYGVELFGLNTSAGGYVRAGRMPPTW
jgi:uncharacterized protein YkwD